MEDYDTLPDFSDIDITKEVVEKVAKHFSSSAGPEQRKTKLTIKWVPTRQTIMLTIRKQRLSSVIRKTQQMKVTVKKTKFNRLGISDWVSKGKEK
jgi:hypothetical protein